MDKQPVFFLGGADLEMCAISDVLRSHHLLYEDRSLQWNNAYLSQYQVELRKYSDNTSFQIFGIELYEDMTPPVDYIRIDHHNDCADNPSALEQIAKILSITLNRYQQLIAINDKSYIPGLQAAGATSEEIAQIRYSDRKAQGVTEEEEKLAEQAIKENKEQDGNLTIVHALSSRFSPICDRLYPYEKLLIYTNREIMYYGQGIDQLIQLFNQELTKNQYFYGGGTNGYIGTVSDSCSFEQLRKIINQIKRYKHDL